MNKEQFINELLQLISVTQIQFQQYYLPTINCEIEDNFLLTIDALKRRRAKMLPIGGDAETCYQQRDYWTLAVFIAATFGVKSDLESKLTTMQFVKLKKYSIIWSELEAYRENSQQTIFHDLIKIEVKKAVFDQRKHFINWLTGKIKSHEFSVNQKNDVIYRINEGLLICLQPLLSEWQKNIVEADLNKHEFPLNSTTFKPKHYYYGDWSDRDVITGIVLPKDMLNQDLLTIEINNNLFPEL